MNTPAKDPDEIKDTYEIIKEHLEDLEEKRILVIGDAILDRHIYTQPVVRPRLKQPLLTVLKHNTKQKHSRPGGAACMAYVAKQLGADVTFSGIVGQDRAGEKLREKLDSAFRGIEAKSQTARTEVVTRYYARTTPRHYTETVRVDRRSDIDKEDLECLAEHLLGIIEQGKEQGKKFDVVLLGNYNRGVICTELFEHRDLAHKLRENSDLIVIGGRSCNYELLEALNQVDLVAFNWFELVRSLAALPWSTKWPKRPSWLEEEAPPRKSVEQFVNDLMQMCSKVNRFFINETQGPAIAIQRDPLHHGIYKYTTVLPTEWRSVTSIAGADTLAATFGALALAGKGKTDFFGAAYTMKYISGAQLNTRAETFLAKDELEKDAVDNERRQFPLPTRQPIRYSKAPREKEIQQVIGTLHNRGSIDLQQMDAFGKFLTKNEKIKEQVQKAKDKLRPLITSSNQPIRLYIDGPPGTGKEILANGIAWTLGYNGVVQVQHDELKEPNFSMANRFKEALHNRNALLLNEIDKGLEPVEGDLLTLLDNASHSYAGLLVIGIGSRRKPLTLDIDRRFDKSRKDAAHIDIPPFKERIDDLPYLLGSALASEFQRHRPSDTLPRFSPAALELMARAPDIYESKGLPFTFTNVEAAAHYIALVEQFAEVHLVHMAHALDMRPEEELYGGTLNPQQEKAYYERLAPSYVNEDNATIEIRGY